MQYCDCTIQSTGSEKVSFLFPPVILEKLYDQHTKRLGSIRLLPHRYITRVRMSSVSRLCGDFLSQQLLFDDNY